MKLFKLARDFDWLIAAAYIAVFVLPFSSVGGYEVYKIKRLHDSSVRTSGTVIGNSYSITADEEGGAYYPVVEFEAAGIAGKTRFTDGIGSLPADYAVGDRLTVIYNPENPREARVYSWKRIWFAPILFIVIGLLPLAVPFVIFRMINRRSKMNPVQQLAEQRI